MPLHTIIYGIIYEFIDRRGSERRHSDERLFEQHKQLYLMVLKLGDELSEVKKELKRTRQQQESDLSAQVFDVC